MLGFRSIAREFSVYCNIAEKCVGVENKLIRNKVKLKQLRGAVQKKYTVLVDVFAKDPPPPGP